MKVKSITPLNDGMARDAADKLWNEIEGFAAYSFNKSHTIEYALISYQAMWLKTYYPVEFFAAALSLMDDDKLPALIKDAERFGITISLPDVNTSTQRFEMISDTLLAIPFARVKGLSEKASLEIVEKRKIGGPFKSKEDFEKRCRSRMVHSGKIQALNLIGAFASVEPGQLQVNHPDRIVHQRDLIPGLISANVPVNRDMMTDHTTKAKIVLLMRDYKAAHGPAGDGDGLPVGVAFGSNAKFMVIQDAPNKEEEQSGKMTSTKGFGSISEALSEAGLNRTDAYWTALIKRPKEGRQVTPDEVSRYAPYLTEEIELLKPPVIVLLGSQAVRSFYPDFKGKASDLAGQVSYDKKLDANIVIGFAPGEIYYAPEKQVDMNAIFEVVAGLIQ